jgi:hypothetical protein
MCYTCGCGLPYEDHGDPRNITEHHLEQAGQTKEIKKAGKTAAKKNVLELLELQKDGDQLTRPKESYADEL